MATCDWCHQEMTGKTGCTAASYMIGGQEYPRIPAAADCHDCLAPAGTLHHPGCDMERCPACRGQAISCGCDDPPECEPDDAEAQRIAETYADAAQEYAQAEETP